MSDGRRAVPAVRRHALESASFIALTLAGLASASAQPSGASVVTGHATVAASSATSTIITQSSQKAIINWQSFSVAAGSTVQFNQPGSSAITLNRVTGTASSAIDGAIRANGQVWLINPNGVMFGQGATINVGGLLATSADIADPDFMAGRYVFSGALGGSSVTNNGTIRARKGGSVVLSSPSAANNGLIAANAGHVVLGGTDAFTVDFQGDRLLSYAVTGTGKSALNTGAIKAVGGTVLMTTRAAADIADGVVNNSGMVQATSAHAENGEIVLDAGSGTATDSGTLDASGTGAGQTGGTVKILGAGVAVADGAKIDVSGDAGGGAFVIGGDLHGAGPDANAKTATVGKATITADAIHSGKGGQVVVWSDDQTSFDGQVSAKGGQAFGDGGQIETSGQTLTVGSDANVMTLAPAGTAGDWLLDPQNIVILNNGSDPATQTFGNNVGDTAAIAPTTIERALISGNVTLQANTDITVESDLDITTTAANTLALQAGRSITLNGGSISYAAGTVTLSANDPGAVATDRLSGAASLTSNAYSISAANIDLVLNSDGSDGGSIGTASNPFNIVSGNTYIQTLGANAFLSSVDPTTGIGGSLTLGNANHTLSVDMGVGSLTITANGVTQITPLSLTDLTIQLPSSVDTGNPIALDDTDNAITGTVNIAAQGGTFGGTSAITLNNAQALTLGAITVTPDPNGNGDYGAITIATTTGDLTLNGAVEGGEISLTAGGNLVENTNGSVYSHHTGNNTIGGGLALDSGGLMLMEGSNVIESGIVSTGNGSETALATNGEGELVFVSGSDAYIQVQGDVAFYGAYSGGALSLSTSGTYDLSDASGNITTHQNGIDIFNPLSAAGTIGLSAPGDIVQHTLMGQTGGDTHITTPGALLITSTDGAISLTDPNNQVSGYAVFNSAGDTSFTNSVTTVLGGPEEPDGYTGGSGGYTPQNSMIGGALDIEVTDLNQTDDTHSNLILAGNIRAESTTATSTLHATGDIDNNDNFGSISADNLSLVSDDGAIGGKISGYTNSWNLTVASNSGDTLNLHADAAQDISIGSSDPINIGIAGFKDGIDGQFVTLYAGGDVTQNNDTSGIIVANNLELQTGGDGNITLNNAYNASGWEWFFTPNTTSFTDSIDTFFVGVLAGNVDSNNNPNPTGDVTITVHDPSGQTTPGLTLGAAAYILQNNAYSTASIDSTGHVALNLDGGFSEVYEPTDTEFAGHIVADSLSITAGGAISMLNPVNSFNTLTVSTINQDIAITTGQSANLVVGDSGIGLNAGTGNVTLLAPNAEVLASDPIIGDSVFISGASIEAGDIEARAFSAQTSGGQIEVTSGGVLNIENDNGGVGLDSGGGAVTIAGTSVTQADGDSGKIAAGNLEVVGSDTGGITLNNAENAVSGLIDLISSGDASLVNGQTTTLETAETQGSLTVQSAGDLVIPSNGFIYSHATSGDAVVLAASDRFLNRAGANTLLLSGDARFLIYSDKPSNDVFGGLNSNNTAIWDTSYPATITQSGSRYVFAIQPTLTITAGALAKTYGDNNSAVLAGDYTITGLNPGVAGAYNADTAASVFSGAPQIASSGAAATADAGTYAITGAVGSLKVMDGYALAFQNSQLTVNPRSVSVALQGDVAKSYDGSTAATLDAGNYTALSGVVNGDAVALNAPTAGVYDTADVGTGKMVAVTGLSLTGAKASDYVIATSVMGAVGEIDPRILSVALQGSVTKTYDGSTAAALAAGNYTALTGVLNGDAVSVNSPTAGTYDTADVGTGKTVTVTGLTLSGAKAFDYTIAASVSGTIGEVDPRTLTIALQGSVSKTYDGNTAAILAQGNYSALTGVVGSDAVTLATYPATGSYDTPDVGDNKTVTVTGIALSGAKAADYVIAGMISGAVGTILPADTGTNTGTGTTEPPSSDTDLRTATVANQSAANQPTRPGTLYLETNTGVAAQETQEDAAAGTPPQTDVLAPAATSPIAELAQGDTSTGEPESSSEQVADYLGNGVEGAAHTGHGNGGIVIPGLLRAAGHTRASGGPVTGLSAWGNGALWQ